MTCYENKTYFHATWCINAGMKVFYEVIIFYSKIILWALCALCGEKLLF